MAFKTLWVIAVITLLSKCSKANVVVHFGGCRSQQFGKGTCLQREDCQFYAVDSVEIEAKQNCKSQVHRNLVSATASGCGLTQLLRRQSPRPNILTNADELPQSPNCGIEFTNRIYGGDNTSILEFTWTALLQYTSENNKKSHLCGGSFIAQRWVLTAAHCVLPQFIAAGTQLTGVRLGEWNTDTDPDCVEKHDGTQDCIEPHIDVQIDRIIAHERFDSIGFGNDIALLRLQHPIGLAQYRHITPICLPLEHTVREDRLVNAVVDVAGWGRTERNDTPSVIKRKAMLRVWRLDDCQERYKPSGYKLDDTQLCASGGHGVDTCRGDSGGPLMIEGLDAKRNNYYYLAGIVSYGRINCAQRNFPGVYTRVGAFIDWIKSKIRENSH